MLISGTNRQVHSLILWVVLLAIIAVSPGVLAAGNPFAEVPDGHWSYRALDRLRELGLGYTRGSSEIRLTTRLTRVEIAIEVADVLDRVVRVASGSPDTLSPRILQVDPAALVATYNQTVPKAQRLTDDDISLIADLINHYRPELEALGYRFDSATGTALLGLSALGRSVGRLLISQSDWLRVETLPALVDDTFRSDLLRRNPTTPGLELHPMPMPQTDVEVASEGGFQLIPFQVAPQEPTVSDDLLTRFGDLAGTGWEELALNAPEALFGMESGVKLGQLGSTVLLARRGSGEQADYVAGLDGALELDRFTVGATVLRSVTALPAHEDSDSKTEGTVAGLQGSYRLSPGVLVTAGLAGSIWGDQDASLLRFGGVLQISDDMSLEAVYRLQEAGFRTMIAQRYDPQYDELAPERKGLDLAFDIGYARLTAAVGEESWLNDQNSTVRKTTTSLGVLYPVNELTTLRASREEIEQRDQADASERSHTTELGVDFSIPRMNMNLKLGYALIERWNEADAKATERTSATELGVEYQLSNGSFALRYKVTDVSGALGEPLELEGSNVGAEITIRF